MAQIGLDALALGSRLWPMADTIRIIPKSWAIGCFDNVDGFGDARSHLQTLIGAGYKTFRVHLFWPANDQHTVMPDMHYLRRRAQLYERIARQHPGVKIFLSPRCEYQLSDTHILNDWVHMLHMNAPSCVPVFAPMKSPAPSSAIIERHGDTHVNPGQFISFDGADYRDCDWYSWIQRNKSAAQNFFWFCECNGSERGGPKMPRSQRMHYPTARMLRDLVDTVSQYYT